MRLQGIKVTNNHVRKKSKKKTDRNNKKNNRNKKKNDGNKKGMSTYRQINDEGTVWCMKQKDGYIFRMFFFFKLKREIGTNRTCLGLGRFQRGGWHPRLHRRAEMLLIQARRKNERK